MARDKGDRDAGGDGGDGGDGVDVACYVSTIAYCLIAYSLTNDQ
jgi:GTPase involved in cell partitioning and DNA repair